MTKLASNPTIIRATPKPPEPAMDPWFRLSHLANGTRRNWKDSHEYQAQHTH